MWDVPPRIKVYEALSCVGDDRIEIEGEHGFVTSSTRNKVYEVAYDEATEEIMANDNGSYYVGYLGYPAIAYLMAMGELPFNERFAEALAGIPWKDWNQRYDNDYDKTMNDVFTRLEESGVDIDAVRSFVDRVMSAVEENPYGILGEKQEPPDGY